MSKNYYEILGLSKGATTDEIKKAYRKLAMQHHPDRGGNAETFKEINEAYSVLGDEQKRNEYDTYGRVGGGGNPFGGAGFDVDLGDIFEQFFGGSQRTSRIKQKHFRGEDLEYYMKIDLKTSIIGGKNTIHYDKYVTCDDCHGEGGSGKKTCFECKGSGYVVYRQQSMFGVIEHRGTCKNCGGSGQIFEQVCHTCSGNKRVKKTASLEVDIPAGIDAEMVIKIEGEGNHGIGGETGDLYIRFQVNTIDKGLHRKGVHLYYDLEIDVIEAILGTTKEVNIPIIGKRSISIVAGTQFGTVIKIVGDGVKHIDRDKKGDLFININIKIPKKLSETERTCFEKIALENKLSVHNKKGILEKFFG